jgi:hypothetical protein
MLIHPSVERDTSYRIRAFRTNDIERRTRNLLDDQRPSIEKHIESLARIISPDEYDRTGGLRHAAIRIDVDRIGNDTDIVDR